MRQTCIPLSSPRRWRRALEGVPHAFGHTWENCRAMALTTGFPTYLYTFEDGATRLVCPIAERTSHGHTDLVTPYGFSGFTGTGSAPGFPEHWRRFARARGYVCGYIGLHPMLFDPAHADPADVQVYNTLYVLDLEQSEERLFAGLHENRRRQVRAAARAPRVLVEDRGRLTAFFLEHYAGFFARKNAGAAYTFSRETIARLLAGAHVLLLGAGTPAGRLEAVCVFAYTPYGAEYLFGLSVPGGQPHSAPLVWEGALRLKALGLPWLNLGGGIREGDGVAGFKERFGGRRLPLGALRQVYDPEAFTRLCGLMHVDPALRGGYFPPYRDPRRTTAGP